MSGFVETSERLGTILGNVPVRAQVAFYIAAARALHPGYADWTRDRDVDPSHAVLLDDALAVATLYALSGRLDPRTRDLLAAMEEHAPHQEDSAGTFVVAQDCWICADIALRLIAGGFSAADGVWYVLEPQFQATTEGLFGFTDVGSQDAEVGEAAALATDELRGVLTARRARHR